MVNCGGDLALNLRALPAMIPPERTGISLIMPAPDYQRLIDAATWGFIRDSEASYPPDTASLSIADQRQIYDTMCAKFHRGYPAGVVAEDRQIAGVACRVTRALPQRWSTCMVAVM